MGEIRSIFFPMLAAKIREFILKQASNSYMIKQKDIQIFLCLHIVSMWSTYSEDVGGDRHLIAKISSMLCSEATDVDNIKLLLAELSKLYKDGMDGKCKKHSTQLDGRLISLKEVA